ncbi:MAG TPA: hypothetical protein VLE49_10940 [Anaerolineales bacterium]|nr:hypothetical protein [Anaerolineales bacterium]
MKLKITFAERSQALRSRAPERGAVDAQAAGRQDRSPKSEVHPLRVLWKAVLLFVIGNLVFALVNPPLGKITLYNSLIPGRLRFPYEDKASFYTVGYSVPINEDFDAMFGAHVISRRKASNEFRLILLGDSATWGFGLAADEMLSEQINRLNIQTCDGRVVRAYNLAYPFSYLTRDLLLLDKAMEYQPDMVLWLVTLSTLEPKAAETNFIVPHWQRYGQLADTYDLKLTHFSQPIQEPPLWDRTIVGQRKRIKNLALLQTFGVLWAGTGIDNHESLRPEPGLPSPNVADNLDYEGRSPDRSSELLNSLLTNVLVTAYDVAGDVPVVLVNEPIFVASGKNHLVRYNGFYPRWVYDEYREFLLKWTDEHDHKLLDYWNAVPPEDFADAYFHRRLSGEKRFAELLAPEIKGLACP